MDILEVCILQAARKIHVGKFSAGRAHVMVVTDVAARGIDIPLLDNVINFDFPPKPKLFVHRVGRAARAGEKVCCRCKELYSSCSSLSIWIYHARLMTMKGAKSQLHASQCCQADHPQQAAAVCLYSPLCCAPLPSGLALAAYC